MKISPRLLLSILTIVSSLCDVTHGWLSAYVCTDGCKSMFVSYSRYNLLSMDYIMGRFDSCMARCKQIERLLASMSPTNQRYRTTPIYSYLPIPSTSRTTQVPYNTRSPLYRTPPRYHIYTKIRPTHRTTRRPYYRTTPKYYVKNTTRKLSYRTTPKYIPKTNRPIHYKTTPRPYYGTTPRYVYKTTRRFPYRTTLRYVPRTNYPVYRTTHRPYYRTTHINVYKTTRRLTYRTTPRYVPRTNYPVYRTTPRPYYTRRPPYTTTSSYAFRTTHIYRTTRRRPVITWKPNVETPNPFTYRVWGNPTPPPTKVGLPLVCGIKPAVRRIVGGSEANDCEYPWMVSIISILFCGGTIIDETHILTAAHCFKDGYGNLASMSDVKVSVGSSDLNKGTIYKIKSWTVHPRHSPSVNDYDIAILTLSEPLKYGPCVAPICMAAVGEDPAASDGGCVAAGWGLKHFRAKQVSRHLMEVPLPIVPDYQCLKAYGHHYFNTLKLCAGNYHEGGVDSCKGDSGGPLMCKTDGVWYQHGIVSFGRGCAAKHQPGVYTRIAHPDIRKFIVKVVSGG